MSRYMFWVLLVACLLAAAAVYVLKVAAAAREVETRSREVVELAAQAEKRAAGVTGPNTLATLLDRQEKARKDLGRLRGEFEKRDADNLDRWFDGLGARWGDSPTRDEFKRHYNLGVDELIREVGDQLQEHGIPEPTLHVLEYPWMQADREPPEKDRLRGLQREFWVQDRVMRAMARHGAYFTRPLRGDDTVVRGAAGAPFDRMRFDVQVRCRPTKLHGVLHALDGPFQVEHRDGHTESVSLPVVIDNVSVRRIAVDNLVANRWYPGEPPVEVSLYVTILDFDQRSAK